MSFAEMLAEIPRLSAEQRRELVRRVNEANVAECSIPPASGFQMETIDGRLVLTAPRVIRQSEVDAILEDFP